VVVSVGRARLLVVCVPSFHRSCDANPYTMLAVAGTTCTEVNAYYSQCLPGAASSAPASVPPTTVSQPSHTSTATGTAPTGLASIPASTLYQFSNFGTNPNNVAMYVYKPKKVATNPPLIVASHCECLASSLVHSDNDICPTRLPGHCSGLLRGLQVCFTL
jgi:hypothetical protein